MARKARQPWWDWDIEYTAHLLDRMVERQFTDGDLRAMFDDAVDCVPDLESGRWVIQTVLHDEDWEIVVEPDHVEQVLVVITAYMV